MIILYSGTPGSCKSMHQAELVYKILNYGGVVLANYNIKTSLIPNYKGTFWEYNVFDLKPSMLKDFSRMWFSDPNHKFKEGELNLFIDEAQLIFNSREWGRSDRREWLEFFTQHRKYGYDIFLIAQNDKMLDKQIRALIEYEYIHRKFSNGGVWNKIFNFFMGGGTYVAIKMWYPMGMPLGHTFYHIRKKYYSLYDSYADFGIENRTECANEGEAEAQRHDKGGEPLALSLSAVLHQVSTIPKAKQGSFLLNTKKKFQSVQPVERLAEGEGKARTGSNTAPNLSTGQETNNEDADGRSARTQAQPCSLSEVKGQPVGQSQA